jgi:hypothetical protein
MNIFNFLLFLFLSCNAIAANYNTFGNDWCFKHRDGQGQISKLTIESHTKGMNLASKLCIRGTEKYLITTKYFSSGPGTIIYSTSSVRRDLTEVEFDKLSRAFDKSAVLKLGALSSKLGMHNSKWCVTNFRSGGNIVLCIYNPNQDQILKDSTGLIELRKLLLSESS